jgi:hypothetical protein
VSGGAARRLAWSLCTAAILLLLAGAALSVGVGDFLLPDVFLGLAVVVLAVMGALVASRRPANVIGWLFCGAATMLAAGAAARGYAGYALLGEPGSLPGGEVAAWLDSWLFLPPLFGLPPLLFLLFPSGRPLTPRWRVAVALTVVAMSLQALATALSPGPLEDAPIAGIQNPLGLGSGDALFTKVEAAGWALGLTAVVVALASVVMRTRRARGEERLQLRWLTFAAALFVLVCIVSSFIFATDFAVIGQVLIVTAYSAIPIATGVAILRYRLYDIDVVVNRTLVYGALTAGLVAAYLGTVLLLQLALSPLTSESDLAIAGSTLAVAALFRPLRSRIQATVDRRFYRRRYDARRTLESFGARLRNEVELDSLDAELRWVVAQTMQPAHVSVWLRTSETAR